MPAVYSRPTLVQGNASAFGTGNPTITAQAGVVPWSSLVDAVTIHYVIQDNPADAKYEWGLGTKTTVAGAPVLQRLAANVLGGSSGAGVLVNFTANKQMIYAAPLGEVEVLPNVSADPAVASTGQLAYRTDTSDLRAYAGSAPAWVSVVRSDNLLTSFGQQNANKVLIGPTIGNGLPSFRTLVKADQFSTTVYRDSANVFNVSSGAQIFRITDAGTNSVVVVAQFDHESSATPAAGFGVGMQFVLGSDTVTQEVAAEWDAVWATAADASRAARIIGYVYDATAAREFMRADTDGTQALPKMPNLAISGMTGAVQASRYAGATASGAPVAGTFIIGDFVIDRTGNIWICTTAGTPGTWTEVGMGAGSGVSSFNTRSGAVTLTTADVNSAMVVTDAATATVTQIAAWDHESSGAPAAGFGGGNRMLLKDSTTANQVAAEWDWTWVAATHGSTKARIQGFVYDNANAREWIRAESDGTLPIVGICGPALASTMLTVYPASDTYKGLVIRRNSSTSTADLYQAQDELGTTALARTTAKGVWQNDVAAIDNTAGPTGTVVSRWNNAGSTLELHHNYHAAGDGADRWDFHIIPNAAVASTNMDFSIGFLFNSPGVYIKGANLDFDSTTTTLISNPGGNSFTIQGASTWAFNLDVAGGSGAGKAFCQYTTSNGWTVYSNYGGELVFQAHPTSGSTLRINDTVTAAVSTALTVGHHCRTGTPAAGFGLSQLYQLDSSTTANRNAAELDVSWVVATDASRTARVTINAWDTAARECIRCEATGTTGLVGIGGAVSTAALLNVNGTTKTQGFISNLVTKTGNYTATTTDHKILVDSTGGIVTITLPTAVGVAGQEYIVKDWKGTSATNNITIATTSAQTIDGAANKVLSSNYASLSFTSDGANWVVI